MADKKIIVDTYTGGSNGDDLIDCYFKLKNNGTYDFHDKDDHTKLTGLTLNTASSAFELDEFPGVSWTITLTSGSETEVSGNWNSQSDDNTQDGGTFQAQAGGGVDEEMEAENAQQNIIIHKITSKNGTDFGDVLVNCSFELAGNSGKYKFKDPDGGVLHEEVTWADKFRFEYLSQKWELISDIHTIEGKAHGDWTLLEGDDDEVDGGTFQAQAGGGGGVDENAYKATA